MAIARPAAAACLIALSACSTTKVSSQWRDESFQAAPAKSEKVLVAAIASPEQRRVLEDRMVARLRKDKVAAEPSYTYLPAPGPVAEDAARQAVERSGAALVLSMRLLDVDEQTHVSPGMPMYGSMGMGFYGYYPRASVSYSPPQAYVSKTYKTEARLFDIKGDKMVWAAKLETSDPRSFGAAAEEHAERVADAMKDQKLL